MIRVGMSESKIVSYKGVTGYGDYRRHKRGNKEWPTFSFVKIIKYKEINNSGYESTA